MIFYGSIRFSEHIFDFCLYYPCFSQIKFFVGYSLFLGCFFLKRDAEANTFFEIEWFWSLFNAMKLNVYKALHAILKIHYTPCKNKTWGIIIRCPFNVKNSSSWIILNMYLSLNLNCASHRGVLFWKCRRKILRGRENFLNF